MDTNEPVSLSFDKAKFDESGSSSLSCAFCNKDVFGTYYEVNGKTACEECRFTVERARAEGSPFGRGLRALLGSFLGGLVGAGIYYAVLAFTGYEPGSICSTSFRSGSSTAVGDSARSRRASASW